jgi:tetratricopeptide (TPR) repeat protein
MDALKKAELAKRHVPQNKAESASDMKNLELTSTETSQKPVAEGTAKPSPITDPEAPNASGFPSLPSNLELLDREFMDEAATRVQRKQVHEAVPELSPGPRSAPPSPAAAASPYPRATGEEGQRDREAAQNLFNAKQPPVSPGRTFAILTALFTVLAAIGIGLYFWIQLQPRSTLLPAAGSSVHADPPSGPAAQPPVARSEPPAAQATPFAPSAKDEEASEPRPAQPRPEPPPSSSPIRLTTSKQRVDPAIDRAYAALQGGDLSTAQSAYEQALKNDPKNADALHGVAAIHLRQGQTDRAQEYFLRALEADPKDARAQASLIGMNDQIDPGQSESRLKLLLSTQPDSPFLHFYLGNLYARQSRWAEAQQAYFRAMAGEPNNPDYLFNLAVSLDQLHQVKPAAQYYAQALAAADRRTAGFDKQQVSDRLKKLQR